jgi:hypothetical protein
MKKVILVLALLCTGCASQAYRVHPGAGGYVSGQPTATQLFLSQSYDTLSAADVVIQQTRADFLANKFPTSAMPKIRVAFNALVGSYDTAQQAWLTLNAAIPNGDLTLQSALSAAIAALNQALTSLSATKAGG